MRNKAVISLLAILALVLGIFAYLMSAGYLKNEDNTSTKELSKIETVSDSDEVEDIETDLLNTEFDNIDLELESIEKEL